MNALDIHALKAMIPISSVVGRTESLIRRGDKFHAICPFHNDRNPSLEVSDKFGRFKCWACGAEGDIFDFVQRRYGGGFDDARRMLLEGHFGLALPSVPAVSKSTKGSDTRKLARAMWDRSGPIIGTPAERYLERRCIYLSDLPTLPALRFARIWHPKYGDGVPALVSAARDLNGTLTGIQRTYVTEDGVKIEKKSLGPTSGSAVKIGRNVESITVTEGLEDALTILGVDPSSAVWAALGGENLSALSLPNECISVTIARDNDEAGDRFVEKAANAFKQQGKHVRIASPSPQFKDFNEEHMANACCRTSHQPNH